MKVLMIGWEFPPFVTGGLGTHCYNLTKCLSRKGNEIIFLMPSGSGESDSDLIKIIHVGRNKIIQLRSKLKPYVASEAFPVPASGGSGRKSMYGNNFFREVQSFNDLAVEVARHEDFDVIHCHDWMTFPAGVRIKKEKRKPLVVTVHSTEHDRIGASNANDWITHTEWEGMYAADRVITVSGYMRERLKDIYGVPEGKIDVIYNAVETSEFAGEKFRIGSDDKVVLFLGRLAVQKGPDYLLTAAKKIMEHEKNVKFVFVGQGSMLPQLIRQSIEMGIANNVFFTGYQEDKKRFYKSADVYVMPSVSEPFGITALEAIASGTPVIMSKQSGSGEVIKHKMAVDFWDTDQLAGKIIGCLRYPCLRTEMSANSFKEVERTNWMDVAEKTMDVYGSLLS